MFRLRLFQCLLLITASLLTAGCASFENIDSRITPPTVIEKVPLPTPPAELATRDFYIKMEMLISKDGTVRHVVLTRSTGDAEWDSAAVQRIMMWKFSPALLDNKPIQMRIIQTARVVSSQPVVMDLSEIIVGTYAEADSAYRLIREGKDFDSTASMFRSSVPGMPSGHLGEVDIHRFQSEIQDELLALKQGEFTHPLPLGSYFAIFKRH